jgi:hypothetical protein
MYNVQPCILNVQTLLNRVRTLIYPIGCSFLQVIRPAGWPVLGRWDWLLPAVMSVTPIQVQFQAHEFNQHQPGPCQKPIYHPIPLAPCQCRRAQAGVGGGSCPPGPGQCCAGPRPAGWQGVAASAVAASESAGAAAAAAALGSGASPVLKLALDHRAAKIHPDPRPSRRLPAESYCQ